MEDADQLPVGQEEELPVHPDGGDEDQPPVGQEEEQPPVHHDGGDEDNQIVNYQNQVQRVGELRQQMTQAAQQQHQSARLVTTYRPIYINGKRKLRSLLGMRTVRPDWTPEKVIIFHSSRRVRNLRAQLVRNEYNNTVIKLSKTRLSRSAGRQFNKFSRCWARHNAVSRQHDLACTILEEMRRPLIVRALQVSAVPVPILRVGNREELDTLISLKQTAAWRIEFADSIEVDSEIEHEMLQLATAAHIRVEGRALLEQEGAEVRDVTCCVCWDREKEVVFGCGHQICMMCAANIQQCPTCRAIVDIRVRLFN